MYWKSQRVFFSSFLCIPEYLKVFWGGGASGSNFTVLGIFNSQDIHVFLKIHYHEVTK